MKVSILSKAIYRCNAFPIKLPMVFFTEPKQIISQWKHKRPWIAKAISVKNETGGINLPVFSLYYKLQSSRHCGTGTQKYRSMEQNTKPGDKSTHLWAPYIWQEAKNIQWRKDSLFNQWCWENWSTMYKRIKLEHFLTPCTKINSKWIKGLNVRPEAIKVLEESISRTLSDISCRNIFPRVREIKTQINKWGLIKVKIFCTAKKILNKMKRQHTV